MAEIQKQLQSLGYDVAADGDYGPATTEAVKAFQSTKGLEADGLVGASTYSALLGKSMPVVTHSMNAMSRTVVSDAMSYMGVPYVFGGNTPSSGFDCSGYVRYVFANAGIYLPRDLLPGSFARRYLRGRWQLRSRFVQPWCDGFVTVEFLLLGTLSGRSSGYVKLSLILGAAGLPLFVGKMRSRHLSGFGEA